MIDMIGVGRLLPCRWFERDGRSAGDAGMGSGALLAVCDGLVWAELGAAMPGSGGSYRYLREIYGPQQMGTADFVSVYLASFVQRAAFDCYRDASGWRDMRPIYWPELETVYAHARCGAAHSVVGHLQVSWIVTPGTAVAVAICFFTVLLLYRRITAIGRLSKLLWFGVMGTIGWIIFAGLTHFNAARVFDFPPGAFTLSRGFFTGLGGAHADCHLRLLGLLQRLLSGR